MHDVSRHEGAGLELHPLSHWKNRPPPAPVIWHAAVHGEPWPIVSVGEPGCLSGPDGAGKSWLALQVALASATAYCQEKPYGEAIGLRVRAGPVVVLAYEDTPRRLFDRVGDAGAALEHVHVLDAPEPLYCCSANRRISSPSHHWESLWDALERLGARSAPPMLVLDPAAEILSDAPVGEAGPVRALMRALARESNRTDTGVLIVSHDTKTSRTAGRAGGDPGAGAIAGSSAWSDRARGVLYLHVRDPQPDRAERDRVLVCRKSSHGPVGWGVAVSERRGRDGRLIGFRGDGLSTSEVVARLARWQGDAKSVPPPMQRSGRPARARPRSLA